MDDTERYEKARKRVEAKLGFYIHAAVYANVNLLLIVINLVTSTKTIWFVWPLIGWGIGLAIHAALVFLAPQTGSLKERMIEREMERMDLDQGG